MMIKHLVMLFILISFAPWALATPYETVVTASRSDRNLEQIADDLTVITKEELKASNTNSVDDILKNVTGLQSAHQGGLGQTSSIFIRGANAYHTLVLLDGVPLNDPSAPARAFDFANMNLEGIDHIEVLRGPQSILYGSDAVSGVINFITEKGSGPPRIHFDQSFGSYQSTKSLLGLSGSFDKYYYSLSTGLTTTAGFPAADEQLGNSLPSPAAAQSLNARVGGPISSSTNFDFIFRYLDSNLHLDARGGANADDPNYTSRTRQAIHHLQTTTDLFDHFWQIIPSISFVQIDRNDLNSPDLNNPSFSYDDYHAKSQKYSLQNNFYFSNQESLITGIEYLSETSQSLSLLDLKKTDFPLVQNNTNSIFAENIWTSSLFFATAGARYDQYSSFDSATTFKIAPGLKIQNTRIRSAVATGFKTPALYQLYSQFGSPTLKPEQSSSWEIGADQTLDNLILSATFFNSNFRQLIDYDFVHKQYQNITGADSKGIEFESSLSFFDLSKLRLAYTYVDAIDTSTGQRLLRRARNNWQLEYSKSFNDRLSLLWQTNWLSERDDLNPVSFERESLPGYSLTDIAVSFKIQKDFELYSRIDNLFDKIYESVDGFGTARRSVYIGLCGEI